MGNSFGVAGYVSGEAYKLGQNDPYYRMSRAFFRQTINLGGETQKVDPDLNQLGGSQTANCRSACPSRAPAGGGRTTR